MINSCICNCYFCCVVVHQSAYMILMSRVNEMSTYSECPNQTDYNSCYNIPCICLCTPCRRVKYFCGNYFEFVITLFCIIILDLWFTSLLAQSLSFSLFHIKSCLFRTPRYTREVSLIHFER